MSNVATLYIGTKESHLDPIKHYFSSVTPVKNESEALEKLTQCSYDCILVDDSISMEEALDIIERIKKVKKSILSIILCENPQQQHLLRAIHIGISNILTLPLDPKILKDMAQKLHYISLNNRHLIKKNVLLNQYKNALDSSLNISKTNIYGVITYANEKFCQLTGFDVDEIIGQTHRLFKHPSTTKEQMQNLWETLEAKKVWHDTVVNQTKTGKTFYSDTFIIPLLNERHEVEEYMDMRIDVTAIHEQKRYMQQILDAQNTLIVVFKGEEITQCNQRFLQYFNVDSLEEFLRIHKCICNMAVPAPECINTELFKKWVQSSKNTFDIKISLKRHDEEVRVFNVTKNWIETPSDQQTILSLTDVTTMDNYRHALQTKFNRATQEIKDQQERLVAQSRSAALGEMFDNIAHQWRQPIGAINNAIINAEFALELGGMSHDEILETFKQINTYTAFLSGTIDDFRNFSNPDKENTHFTPHAIIAQTISIVQGSYSENNISLTYVPTADQMRLEIYGPAGEFSQVILNILSNARDAIKEKQIPKGNVHIQLGTLDETVVLSLADNAGGIPEAILPKIFDPYFSTKNKAQGTGIGLYMSKTIIEKHFKGKLEAHNEGDGAIFTITLPILKSVEHES
jgi:PAS domain S-box-containing protein